MGFKKFTKVRSRIDVPKVGIWKSGMMSFNSSSMNEYGLRKYTYVVLYYDEDTNRVGMKFTNDQTAEGIMKLNKRKNVAGANFSCKAFLRTYKIEQTNVQFFLKHDEESGLYVFDLNEPVK
jgi:hypothetical protein